MTRSSTVLMWSGAGERYAHKASTVEISTLERVPCNPIADTTRGFVGMCKVEHTTEQCREAFKQPPNAQIFGNSRGDRVSRSHAEATEFSRGMCDSHPFSTCVCVVTTLCLHAYVLFSLGRMLFYVTTLETVATRVQ